MKERRCIWSPCLQLCYCFLSLPLCAWRSQHLRAKVSVDRSSAACVSIYGHVHGAWRDVASEYLVLRSCPPFSVAPKTLSPLESSAVGDGLHTYECCCYCIYLTLQTTALALDSRKQFQPNRSGPSTLLPCSSRETLRYIRHSALLATGGYSRWHFRMQFLAVSIGIGMNTCIYWSLFGGSMKQDTIKSESSRIAWGFQSKPFENSGALSAYFLRWKSLQKTPLLFDCYFRTTQA